MEPVVCLLQAAALWSGTIPWPLRGALLLELERLKAAGHNLLASQLAQDAVVLMLQEPTKEAVCFAAVMLLHRVPPCPNRPLPFAPQLATCGAAHKTSLPTTVGVHV